MWLFSFLIGNNWADWSLERAGSNWLNNSSYCIDCIDQSMNQNILCSFPLMWLLSFLIGNNWADRSLERQQSQLQVEAERCARHRGVAVPGCHTRPGRDNKPYHSAGLVYTMIARCLREGVSFIYPLITGVARGGRGGGGGGGTRGPPPPPIDQRVKKKGTGLV